MVRQRASFTTNLLQYSMLFLFTLQALLETRISTREWWAILALVAALAALIQFWPRKHSYRIPYLLVFGGLIFALSVLNGDFMYMVFQFSVISVLLLSPRRAFAATGVLCLALLGLLWLRNGVQDLLFPGMILVSGSFAFGYAYHMQERADEEREKAQRLLDELRAAHERLEAYARQAQELAAAEERNRLGRELHDTVKQQAFAVSGQLGAARARLQADPAAAQDHLLKAEALMDEVRQELGEIIQALRPATLQEQGLAGALRAWGAGWSQQSGVALEVRAETGNRLPPGAEQALLRIAQEALANTARHSHASRAAIWLECENGLARLTIEDDGAGFDLSTEPRGMGLNSMRERAEQLPSGSFTVDSAPGRGTRVTVCCSTGDPTAVGKEKP